MSHTFAESLLVCVLYFIIKFHYRIIFVLLHLCADEELASLNMIKSAPVGPVAGGIMGCIMVLVLAVYAYRHQIHRRSHQHMSPLAAQGESAHSESWKWKLFLPEAFGKYFLTLLSLFYFNSLHCKIQRVKVTQTILETNLNHLSLKTNVYVYCERITFKFT